MTQIILRPARYSELPRIAHISAQAFWDDNLYGDLIHPHRKAYPADMDLWWLRRARVNFWDYTWQWIVAVEIKAAHNNNNNNNNNGQKETQQQEVVVGIAQWVREGQGGKKMQCAWYDPRSWLKPLSSVAMKVHALLWPNRACDPAEEDIIDRTHPFLDGAWTGERSESWYLDMLAVHPDHQGKGIGRKLVAWGLARAEAEGVCASLISALGKDAFYQKCGFDVQDGRAGDGEGNPLANVGGGNKWWKMPKKSI